MQEIIIQYETDRLFFILKKEKVNSKNRYVSRYIMKMIYKTIFKCYGLVVNLGEVRHNPKILPMNIQYRTVTIFLHVSYIVNNSISGDLR